ncbi:MAG: 30S ribosome-binding factor RbfA [Candidatus Azambacteria bacterium]|nr:30S ribosome-binding factor RbfA [Candidatus Azambacteria bacterium]
MAKERAERLSELIKKEVGKIIFDTVDTEPGVLVTVTRAIVNSNLFTADVFISVYPSTEAPEVLKKLDRLIYEIQQLLNKKLRIRPVPKIIFKYDKNPEEASKIESILKEIEEK